MEAFGVSYEREAVPALTQAPAFILMTVLGDLTVVVLINKTL